MRARVTGFLRYVSILFAKRYIRELKYDWIIALRNQAKLKDKSPLPLEKGFPMSPQEVKRKDRHPNARVRNFFICVAPENKSKTSRRNAYSVTMREMHSQ